MSTDAKLTPATDKELKQALAFGLRFEGRKRVHQGDELMAQITAERLVRHLERSGFVVMQRPPGTAPRLPGPAYGTRSNPDTSDSDD